MHRACSPHLLSQLNRRDLLEPVGKGHVFEADRDALDAFERIAVAR
jgi:hypothetical protein